MLFENALRILKDTFGFDAFRPLQAEVIQSVLRAEDNFILMPTGGGKSLCYQIPALALPGVAIVVSPLISLMQDQVEALRANGVRAAFYNSSLSQQEARSVLYQLHQDQLDLFYIAPERLLSESFLARLDEINIALFAIDEAHCVSQWGHDFRPEYVQLGQIKELFPAVPMLALTATADKQTRVDIVKQLKLHKAHHYVASFDRPNIRYTVLEKHKPFEQLKSFLQKHPGQAGIVYCATRRQVDQLTELCRAASFQVAAYHAGLTQKERESAQRQFQRDDIQIVIATIAFGMGIDKPNVRFVVHYDLPKNIESYYQETGRAGRDGLPAEAVLLYGIADLAKIRGLVETNQNEKQKRIELHKLQAMIAFAEAVQCRRKVLLHYFDEIREEECGNCDACIDPLERFDATVDAQKALSCVYRVGQRFGLRHVVDVLRGSKNQRILEYGHDRLSTYGLGQEQSEQHWISIFRQLIHLGYLEQDIAQFSILKLRESARELLRGQQTLELVKPRIRVESVKKVKKAGKQSEFIYDTRLFERLRKLRKQIADSENVAPFIVFSDASLAEMSARCPKTPTDFLAITGVGERKLANYGTAFITAIREYEVSA